MVLMMLVMLGMLSLSSLTLRTKAEDNANSEARANARMALVLAIGELQRSMGPDGNITAPASMLDTDPETPMIDGVKQARLTGVWEARKEVLGSPPNYDRQSPFRRWLVSASDASKLTNMEFPREAPADSVPVAPDQNSEDGLIRAGRVRTQAGGYAWWVGDENCKAHVGLHDELDRNQSPGVAELLASAATPGSHGLEALTGFEEFPSNTTISDKIFTRDLISLAAPGATSPQALFNDLSPYSESVLANVTNGSLRKDLSLFLERKDIDWLEGWGRAEGKSQAPAGPLGPNQAIALSPPKDYDVLSWKSLHHWTNMHRRQIGQGANFPLAAMSNPAPMDKVSNPTWNSGVLRISPVLVRMQLILSYGVRKRQGAPPGPESDYDVFMAAYPVITVWNPYSVALKVKEFSIFLHTLPLEHTIYKNGAKQNITVNGSRNGNYNWGWPSGNMELRIGNAGIPGVTFAPGEARTLTYASYGGGFTGHNMINEIRPWLPGHIGWERNLGTIRGQGSDRIEIETKGASWNSSGASYHQFQETYGFRCEAKDFHTGGFSPGLTAQMFSGQVAFRHETDQGNPVTTFISKDNFPSKTLSELDNSPAPFIQVDTRLKTLDEVQLPNKTWLNTLPAHPYAAATSTQKHAGQGVDAVTTFFAHPYTVTFEQITGLEGLIQNKPFFGPSNTPAGRNKIIAQEIPLVPLTSLAQLQNIPQFPMEGLNWSGYYMQNHAIGNSYASPGLAPDAIKERSFPFYLGEYLAWSDGGGGDLSGKFHGGWTSFNNADYTIDVAPAAVVDRSYAANQLLFDDYFFSSMSAQQGQIFSNYGTERTLQQVVQEFYEDDKALPNAAYRAYSGKKKASDIVESLIDTGSAVAPDAHLAVAAHLMVSGGFNINSTSVKAWTAMLASSHLKQPVTLSNSGGLTVQDRARFVVSRFGTPVGGAADNNAGENSEDNRWLGYRELTVDEVRQLAAAIVKQVKKRGPFRSVGEFVNRRLSTDRELARYGAIQAALEDPEVKINANYRSNPIVAADLVVDNRSANYRFKEAALGSRYQGTPAYISQADILTPIAPLINARSDTFVVRAYGESRSADGTRVLARALCEAVVQRLPEYLDPAEEAQIPLADLTSTTNKTFGRRFTVKSFRWISQQELDMMGASL